MEWYYYILIITGTGLGLLLVYIILRRMKIIGEVPILSSMIDPFFSAAKLMSDEPTGKFRGKIIIREKMHPKLGYWNPKVTEDEMIRFLSTDNGELKLASLYDYDMDDNIDMYAQNIEDENPEIEEVYISTVEPWEMSAHDRYSYNPDTGLVTEKLHGYKNITYKNGTKKEVPMILKINISLPENFVEVTED